MDYANKLDSWYYTDIIHTELHVTNDELTPSEYLPSECHCQNDTDENKKSHQ